MKKIFFQITLLFFIVLNYVSAAEATSWFSPYAACLYIDLTATEKYHGAYNTTFGTGYNDDIIIGQFGIANPDPDARYFLQASYEDLNYSGEDWVYFSSSNPQYQVPFGLDYVVKQRITTNNGGSYTDEALKDAPDRMGYQPAGNADNLNKTIRIELKHQLNGDEKLVAYIGAAVLSLPVDDRSEFYIGKASDYQAGFKIEFTEEKEGQSRSLGTYMIMLTGYVGSGNAPDDEKMLFTVTPNDNSYALDIASLENNAAGIDIGSYYFTTEAVRSGLVESDRPQSSPYHMFVSASRDPFVNDDNNFFVMRHRDVSDTATINARNGFYFKIGLSSNGGNTVWFDGTGKSVINGTGEYVEIIYSDGSLESKFRFEQMTQYSLNGGIDYSINEGFTRSFYDDGAILITMNNEKNGGRVGHGEVDLSAGVYDATIYIHMINEE